MTTTQSPALEIQMPESKEFLEALVPGDIIRIADDFKSNLVPVVANRNHQLEYLIRTGDNIAKKGLDISETRVEDGVVHVLGIPFTIREYTPTHEEYSQLNQLLEPLQNR